MKIIIIGAGKVGYLLAQLLSNQKHDVTVIDKNEERLALIDSRIDAKTVLGDCSSDIVLKDSGAENADILLAVTERDELNIVACFLGKTLGVKITVARVKSAEFLSMNNAHIRETLGIDLIINPDMIAAQRIVKTLNYPSAIDVEYYEDGRVQLLEFRVTRDSAVVGKQLMSLSAYGAFLIVGLLRNGKMIIPKGQDYIRENDLLFLILKPEALDLAEQYFGKLYERDVKRVMIAGSSTLTSFLARQLCEMGLQVKIIEKNQSVCQALDLTLKKAMVIQGDSCDMVLLKDENVENTDLFVAASEDDRLNMLSALIAKNLGATRTVIQLKMSDYIQIAESVGIDRTVSPRILAAATISKYVRLKNVLSVTFIGGGAAEVLEISINESSKHINKPLMTLDFPENAILGAITRNSVSIIPSGKDEVLPGDKLLVFCLPTAVTAVERYFRGKKSDDQV